MNKPYQKEWQKADSLNDEGLPKSAAEVVRQILKAAQARKDSPSAIRAQLFLMYTDQATEERDGTEQIKAAEAFAGTTSGAEKAIWQSITASLYQAYFNNNRWKFYQRTELASATPGDDIATWDAPAFFTKIASLFRASIADRALLQSIPVEQYAPLIEEGVHTRNLRPTLYDLLVFRAIDFFKNEETDIIHPADQFQMDGSLWFEDAERFSSVKVKVKDGSAQHFQALQLYQEAIAFHLKDAKPDALIDADLQRLWFVHQYSVHAEKDSLYLAALRRLEQQYAGNAAVAQVSYTIAVQQLGNVQVISPLGRKVAPANPVRPVRNIPAIKAYLQEIMARYPGSEGAVNAANLIASLSAISLSVKTEEVNLPDENIKALITYHNQATAYLKLYRVPGRAREENLDNQKLLKALGTMKALRSWEQTLPGTADMEEHKAEINIGALPAGSYLLVAASAADIDKQESIVTAMSFQVSALSFIMQQGQTPGAYVLNRKTGYPLAGAKAQFWSQRYNNKTHQYDLKSLGTAVAGADGHLPLPVNKGNDYENRMSVITLNSGSDTLQVKGYFDTYARSSNTDESTTTQTFFFTDRTLYRPGQTVYFKGIMLRSSKQSRDNQVMAGEKTKVHLYDANGQDVQSVELTSNTFGSFSGSFTAPESGMAGQMRIANSNGSAYFSVEEYKRPKFYTEFDTLKASYALEQEVKVKGLAKAYAGNNIDGAQVKYRVVRRARFPYYWCYYMWGMPASAEMEITNGTAVTDESGAFEVVFRTIPDKTVNPQTMPVFLYTVYADVTDLNGETRSGSTTLQAGYRSMQISAAIAEDSRPEELQHLSIRTENLNGVFVPASLKVSIAPLQFPGFLRSRLWEMPDQFVMTEAEFRNAFPGDEYMDEGNYMAWDPEQVVFEKTMTTTADGAVAVPEQTWYRNGWYVITISGKDAQGKEIQEKKYTHVWAPGKKEPVQKPLLAYTAKNNYQPGEAVDIWRATAVDNPYLLASGTRAGGPMQVDGARNPLHYLLAEQDRGGMEFSWLYIYRNRVYTLDKRVDIPWSNKDLQLEWATHRDKLQPGAAEEWTLTIKGNKKEKVTAELLAGMYDASLDAFSTHHWQWNKLFPSVYAQNRWAYNYGFGMANSNMLRYVGSGVLPYDKSYDALAGLEEERLDFARREVYFAAPAIAGAVDEAAVADPVTGEMAEQESRGNSGRKEKMRLPAGNADKSIAVAGVAGSKKDEPEAVEGDENAPVSIRKNLQETAFFFPQLATDADGNVQLKFTMPEALTEWKLMAFAHTADWKTGYLEGKVKTQKDLMVVPNLPRFLRQNDDIVISSKISNLSDAGLSGTASLEILDAVTLKPVAVPFRLKESSQPFTAAKGQSTQVTWAVHVPEAMYTPVVIRVVAKAGNFSDGEESTLPVITNRTLVTETLPLPVRGSNEQTFTLDKLLHQQSNTALNHSLTVEFTGNPAWYAVQALPYLMEYPYECAEQTFNRYYANALAGHIVAQSPKVARIFEQWQQQDTAALLSNLEKNEELKSALLEETPWVMEAKNETEQKHRIALLFAAHKLAKELHRNADKLEQMQLSEGSFPWFKGMQGDRYITQYILTGIGRLQRLKVGSAASGDINSIVSKALPYLDRQLKDDYDALVRNKADLTLQQINASQVQYLYMRSFYTETAMQPATRKAYEYYRKQAVKYYPKFNAYLKGQIASALQHTGDQETPRRIVASLRETATSNAETGTYWKEMQGGYWWHEAPIEAQAQLIETFSETGSDVAMVDAMKVWLLKQKQTQNWQTTKATADACYALLLSGTDWLSDEPQVTINLGNDIIRSSEVKTEAGTGYFKKKYTGQEVKKEMGAIKVKVEHSGAQQQNSVSWGAVYWQYFEDLDKITPAATPLSLKKQLFMERNSDRGPVLTEIKEGNGLRVGDKVKVRIELRVDRDMEYVHMKDMRAACMEPVNVLSGYRYQGGLGYYESTKDVATNFFFDYLRKGTYVFEYPVFVTAKGNFSNGITTIQCMYAPEFSSHSEGIRVQVD